MNKNQNIYYIFLIMSFLLLLLSPYHSHSQHDENEKFLSYSDLSSIDLLNQADSLFVNKKYSESYRIYKSIFDLEKSSPQMLLRMAFIQEGFGDFASALYYLNLYYLKTSDKQALSKMETLASKNQLRGYEFSDKEYFLSYYYKFKTQVTLVIFSIVLMLFALIIYQKRKSKKPPVMAGIFFVFFLAVLFIQVNYGGEYQKGIILNNHSYVMTDPSSGASLVQIVPSGHRVDLIGKEDVWVKIIWNGSPAYIRENNIQKIAL